MHRNASARIELTLLETRAARSEEVPDLGMEDRDWYREKRIDWERGGLKERTGKKRVQKYIFWILAALAAVAAIWFWNGTGL